MDFGQFIFKNYQWTISQIVTNKFFIEQLIEWLKGFLSKSQHDFLTSWAVVYFFICKGLAMRKKPTTFVICEMIWWRSVNFSVSINELVFIDSWLRWLLWWCLFELFTKRLLNKMANFQSPGWHLSIACFSLINSP